MPKPDAQQLQLFEAKVVVDFSYKWEKAGDYTFENGALRVEVPQKPVTTFYG